MKDKNYHRSRKFIIILLALIFFNSVLTLKLRGYQRSKNLRTLKVELKNKYSEKVFYRIEEKSKKEDMWLLIGTNILALFLVASFDRFGVFEESDKTLKENKKKLMEMFL